MTASPPRIPLVDLRLQHREVADRVRAGWERVMERTAFVLGDEVAAFEQSYAEFSGVRYCVGVANGTDALELSLRALSVGAGHEVILPANTFIATALAVVRTGAVPVLADIDPETHLIDLDEVARRVTRRTRAILPVHLYGQMAPVEELRSLAESAGVALVEDAAQAHGASRAGVVPGEAGEAAATSFYPGKNLGAYGDAGAVLTNSPTVEQAVRALGNHGSSAKYHHPVIGFNSRLDTLQAVVLSAKLDHLEAWNGQRSAAAARYDDLLREVEAVRVPTVLEKNVHVWHLYVVRVPNRDRVLSRLSAEGVDAGIHYPVPVHLQGAFAGLGHGIGAFPVTEAAAREVLSLPLFPGITPADQERVVAALRRSLD